MITLGDAEPQPCWALRDAATGRVALLAASDSESEVRRLLASQRVHQPHLTTTEVVEVVITVAVVTASQ